MSSIDPELLGLMTQTIIIENIISAPDQNGNPPTLDGYGRHYVNGSGESGSTVEYGAPVTYKCRLEYKAKVLSTINGRDRVSSGRAYLAGFFPNLTTECRVTVPNQTQESMQHPVVMFIENNFDETGLTGYNTTVHFE
jgi:hypothetical protein